MVASCLPHWYPPLPCLDACSQDLSPGSVRGPQNYQCIQWGTWGYYRPLHFPEKETQTHQLRVSHIYTCSVQLLSRVRLFATPWTTARQASRSITNSRSLPKPMSIELVMPSNHLILCCPLLLLPSIFPGIRVFSNESALCIRWPRYWSFSFNISPSNEQPGLISFRMDWLQSKGLSRVFSNNTDQKH